MNYANKWTAIKAGKSDAVQEFIETVNHNLDFILSNCGKLASWGWVINPNWNIPMVYAMLENDNMETLDQVMFEQYYSYNDNRNINELLDSLQCTQSKLFMRWQPLIVECIATYKLGNYRPCIPSLLSVIEGALAFQCENKRRQKNIEIYLDEQIKRVETSCASEEVAVIGADILVWNSIRSIFAEFFKDHDFNAPRLPQIHRHWILHGRDDCSEWKEIEAIKLFNIINCIEWALENYQSEP